MEPLKTAVVSLNLKLLLMLAKDNVELLNVVFRDKLEVRLKSEDGVKSKPSKPITVPALILKPEPDTTDNSCACIFEIFIPKRQIIK